MINWVIENSSWIFNGIGVVVVALILRWGYHYFLPSVRKALLLEHDPTKPVEKDILGYNDVENALALLQHQISKRVSTEKSKLIIGVNGGGAIVGGILSKHFKCPLRMMYRQPDNTLHAGFDVGRIEEEVIILVDDASRTGRTLDQGRKLLQKSAAQHQELIVACLLLVDTTYIRHPEVTPKKIVDCFAYYTERINIRLPWDLNEDFSRFVLAPRLDHAPLYGANA